MFAVSVFVLLLCAAALFCFYTAGSGLQEYLRDQQVQKKINGIRLKALLKLNTVVHAPVADDPEMALGEVLARELVQAHRAAQAAGKPEAWQEFLPKTVKQVREVCAMITQLRSHLTKGEQEAANRLLEQIDELLR